MPFSSFAIKFKALGLRAKKRVTKLKVHKLHRKLLMLNVCKFYLAISTARLKSRAENYGKCSYGQKFIECSKSGAKKKKSIQKNKQTAVIAKFSRRYLYVCESSGLRSTSGGISKSNCKFVSKSRNVAFMCFLMYLHRCTIFIVLFKSAGSVWTLKHETMKRKLSSWLNWKL